MARINPVVGEVNPAIYNAAKNANLSPDGQLAVEQLSYTIKKAKELRALKVDDAKREFQSLTEEAQTNIKALYPTAKFIQEDPTLLQRGLGAVTWFGKGLLSPIISTLQVAIAYGKTINTGYVVGREVAQGSNIKVYYLVKLLVRLLKAMVSQIQRFLVLLHMHLTMKKNLVK